MNVIKYPQKEEWDELLKRPVMNVDTLRETVCRVMDDVKTGGDRTVMAYEKQFDHVELERLAVTEEEMDEAERLVSPELKDALRLAHDNIGKFHASQRFETTKVEVRTGVTCWQKAVHIERVGLYIHGGTAPLFSTVLMLAIIQGLYILREDEGEELEKRRNKKKRNQQKTFFRVLCHKPDLLIQHL